MSDGDLEVDEQLSWARRVGDDVHVLLRLAHAVLEPGPTHVELADASRRFQLPAVVSEAGGAIRITFSVPRAELGRATWRLGIQPVTGPRYVPILGRLVAAPTSPVALLPGRAPSTRMRPPKPRADRLPARRMSRRLPAPVRKVFFDVRALARDAVGRAQR